MKKVKIKTWEQMAYENRMTEKGCISLKNSFFFTLEMEKEMYENRIIEIDNDALWLGKYYISDEMIEYEIQEDFYTKLEGIVPEGLRAEEFGKSIGKLINGRYYGWRNLPLILIGLSEGMCKEKEED
jgi:hypothetical protein